MRRILGMFAAIALPVAAAAQSLAPITATPLMPPSVQYPAPQQAPQMVQPPSDQLQERALSRRTIHFTTKHTYWECGEGVFCENLNALQR